VARNSLIPSTSGFLSRDPFFALHREMNRLFEDVLRGGDLVPTASDAGVTLAPRINISERGNEICISAELPGVAGNDIHVDLNDDILTIRGEKKLERSENDENFHFFERSFGSFHRAIRLPAPVKPDQVNAVFENGVLTITLPKAEETGRYRQIQVQAGKAGEQHRTAGKESAEGIQSQRSGTQAQSQGRGGSIQSGDVSSKIQSGNDAASIIGEGSGSDTRSAAKATEVHEEDRRGAEAHQGQRPDE
jgi:HSP20 family protein